MNAHEDKDDEPSLRQRLHAATGDRDAEAEALRDRTDDDEVTLADAKIAVQRARGERGADEPMTGHAFATPDDAEEVHEERNDD